MTAQVPATQDRPKPQIATGGQVAALVPQTLDEAFRVSQAIAQSNLAPRGLEKPEQILVAIMAGAELGFAPFQSLQSFAVVNGRPTLWGDGLVAVVRRNGCSIREWHDGDTAYCAVTRPDTGETIERSFSQADAVKAGLATKAGPWQQYPARMRAMRARAWAVRDGCADMLRGFQVAEEVIDYQEVREVRTGPAPTGMRARLEARQSGGQGFDADHVARETGQAQTAAEAAAEILGDDTVPDFDKASEEVIDAEVEEIGEAAADDFPGDKPAPDLGQTQAQEQTQADPPRQETTEHPKPTLPERVAAFRKRMGEATNPTKLKAIRRAADNLFDDMERSDPEGRVELAFEYEERLGILEEEERAERSKGGA